MSVYWFFYVIWLKLLYAQSLVSNDLLLQMYQEIKLWIGFLSRNNTSIINERMHGKIGSARILASDASESDVEITCQITEIYFHLAKLSLCSFYVLSSISSNSLSSSPSGTYRWERDGPKTKTHGGFEEKTLLFVCLFFGVEGLVWLLWFLLGLCLYWHCYALQFCDFCPCSSILISIYYKDGSEIPSKLQAIQDRVLEIKVMNGHFSSQDFIWWKSSHFSTFIFRIPLDIIQAQKVHGLSKQWTNLRKNETFYYLKQSCSDS